MYKLPPAISILPAFGPDVIAVAVWVMRLSRMDGPGENLLETGSYSSVEAVSPPAMRIFPAFGPEAIAVAVLPLRTALIFGPAMNLLDRGS